MGAVVDEMTSGPLVGRDTELRALRRTVEAALEGRPRVVAICGEAGIGKSRLAREALRAAAASSAHTGAAKFSRSGRCWRSARSAANAVTPVANPSSTTITVRSVIRGGGRSPR